MNDDEFELNLDNEDITRKDKRINKLSNDVKEANQKLADEAEAKRLANEEKVNAEKERDFYKGFNTVSSKHPSASEYQDKIWEKVKGGYDIEDATISILAKEGKYNPPAPVIEKETAAGGSATTAMPSGGTKAMEDMTRDEKRAALMEAEAKGELTF